LPSAIGHFLFFYLLQSFNDGLKIKFYEKSKRKRKNKTNKNLYILSRRCRLEGNLMEITFEIFELFLKFLYQLKALDLGNLFSESY